MRHISFLVLFLAFLGISSNSLRAEDITTDILADRLSQSMTSWSGDVKFTVWLPNASEPVVYNVHMEQTPAVDGDKLSPCNYLIEWSAPTTTGVTQGFSAYYDGHHYRYRDERLQEYHMDWDSIPFLVKKMGSIKSKGVQESAQFANLLPLMIADNIRDMGQDPEYSVKIRQLSDGNISLKAVQTINDLDCQAIEYTFSPEYKILKSSTDTGMGTIAEQTLEAVWTPDGQSVVEEINEERLMAAYPEVFEKYRENNFRIENLPGTQLPSFSCPNVAGDRLTYVKGNGLNHITLIALLDPSTSSTSQVISDIRQAVAQLPYPADIIWAFTTTHADEATELTGTLTPDETLLLNARSLARDCGATALPVIIMCEKSGKVADVILGYNKTLTTDVIQKGYLLN